MSKKYAIEAHDLSKYYRIDLKQSSDTLIGGLYNGLTAPIRNARALWSRSNIDTESAAKDASIKAALEGVSFKVERGQVLGIIGHNGAGKSTLLKIMSRITEPSRGYADLNGRVSSLLEVGTGFHSELSGRDNVFMNGTILGMSHREVKQNFDEIVAFSGVEEYIDTPVKFYSSGMKVRLAFAVAAHLSPEILIIDEVLAVGDLAFQEKCLGKMESVSQSGRTILFVSHNMSAVEGLCHRCMLLEGGRKTYDGTVAEAINRYRTNSFTQAETLNLADRTDREGTGRVRFVEVRINEGEQVFTGEPMTLEIDFQAERALENLQIAVKFSRNYREVVMTLDNRMQGFPLGVRPGLNTLRIQIPRMDLLPGNYLIDLWAGVSTRAEDRIFNVATMKVGEHDVYGSGMTPRTGHHGLVMGPVCTWETASS